MHGQVCPTAAPEAATIFLAVVGHKRHWNGTEEGHFHRFRIHFTKTSQTSHFFWERNIPKTQNVIFVTLARMFFPISFLFVPSMVPVGAQRAHLSRQAPLWNF
jgi:hypothetical protein